MNKKNIEISIIIPCYNSYDKMSKCLETLENQNFKNFEVIIIDDCSTDNSYEKLTKYKMNTSLNIKLMKNEKNIGAGGTRNIGLSICIGKYVMFIDADDYIEEDCLEILNNILQNNSKIDCICFDYYRTSEEYKIIDKNAMINTKIKNDIITTSEVLKNVKGCTCGKLYLLDIINNNNIKFADLIRNEDMPFTKIAVSYCKNIYYYNEKPLYYYVMNNKSLMHQKELLDENNAIMAFKKIEAEINPKFKTELELIFITECLYSVICTTITKKYSKIKIKKILKPYIQNYKNWFKNDSIKETPIYIRIILLFFKLNWYLPIRIIIFIKNEIRKQ